jgi:hypothetical protein
MLTIHEFVFDFTLLSNLMKKKTEKKETRLKRNQEKKKIEKEKVGTKLFIRSEVIF